MKKTIFFLLGFLLFLSLAGCKKGDENNNNDDNNNSVIDAFYENNSLVNQKKEEFHTAIVAKIADQMQSMTFVADYYVVSAADTIGGIYYNILNIYDNTPNLLTEDTTVTKNGDSYSITQDNVVAKLKFNNDFYSSSLEIYEDDVLTTVLEYTKTSDGRYAYQVFYDNDDGTFITFQFIFKDNDGRLGVNTEATGRPATIYNLTSVNTNFAKSGTRVYTYEGGVYQFTGTTDFE
jgi:hypothetical protein